jgi:TPR repeat protein
MKICPKCAYQRKASDSAPDWQCPSCGIAYAKYVAAQNAAAEAKSARRSTDKAAVAVPQASGSNTKMMVVGGVLAIMVAFAVWKTKHQPHLSAAQISSSQFDTAKKFYDSDHMGLAFKGFLPLATAGDAKAQYYMGLLYGISWSDNLYEDGARHKADPNMQIIWYTKSAEQGEVLSQLALADVYGRGYGPNADRAPAAHWYQMAADQGDPTGQYNLGLAYEHGQGVGKDEIQAESWYRKAGVQGHTGALYQMGLLYAWGRGVGKNNMTAYQLLALADAIAKRGGGEQASVFVGNDLDALSKQLTESELAEAKQFASNWKTGQLLPQ